MKASTKSEGQSGRQHPSRKPRSSGGWRAAGALSRVRAGTHAGWDRGCLPSGEQNSVVGQGGGRAEGGPPSAPAVMVGGPQGVSRSASPFGLARVW